MFCYFKITLLSEEGIQLVNEKVKNALEQDKALRHKCTTPPLSIFNDILTIFVIEPAASISCCAIIYLQATIALVVIGPSSLTERVTHCCSNHQIQNCKMFSLFSLSQVYQVMKRFITRTR